MFQNIENFHINVSKYGTFSHQIKEVLFPWGQFREEEKSNKHQKSKTFHYASCPPL